MVLQPLSNLPTVRKQHLLVEFSSLKHACPHGVFMSLTPGDPSLWSGVIFVRKGPYAPSILRFQISFPVTYPSLPPLVTFSTDIFHPLVTPLTTYMYTTDIHDGGTVSATDEERLPPGGFSLRGGFPGWFGRSQARVSTRTDAAQTPNSTPQSYRSSPGSRAPSLSSTAGRSTGGAVAGPDISQERISTYEVLRYIRSAFDDAEVLDKIPLEAAGNPGAWQAWQASRSSSGGSSQLSQPSQPKKGASTVYYPPAGYKVTTAGITSPTSAKRPGDWNWDGVWEVRAKKGIEASVSDAMLFGKDVGDDVIRFSNLEGEGLEGLKADMTRSVEGGESQRRGIV